MLRIIMVLLFLSSCGFKEVCNSHVYTVTETGQCMGHGGNFFDSPFTACAVILDKKIHAIFKNPATLGQKVIVCSYTIGSEVNPSSSFFKTKN